MRLFLALLFTFVSIATEGWSVEENYTPFEPGQAPQPYRLAEWKDTAENIRVRPLL
jgi:hypothetical protein